jgi:hypothetical protein
MFPYVRIVTFVRTFYHFGYFDVLGLVGARLSLYSPAQHNLNCSQLFY